MTNDHLPNATNITYKSQWSGSNASALTTVREVPRSNPTVGMTT